MRLLRKALNTGVEVALCNISSFDVQFFYTTCYLCARKIEDVPFEEVHEIQRYGTYFSEKSFWKKIERVAKKVGATVLRPVFTLYYMLQDEKVPLQHKAYIIGALGYFILPFDLIPESVLPIIGFTDDVAVMTFVLKMVKDSITPEIRRKADQKILDLFPDPV